MTDSNENFNSKNFYNEDKEAGINVSNSDEIFFEVEIPDDFEINQNYDFIDNTIQDNQKIIEINQLVSFLLDLSNEIKTEISEIEFTEEKISKLLHIKNIIDNKITIIDQINNDNIAFLLKELFELINIIHSQTISLTTNQDNKDKELIEEEINKFEKKCLGLISLLENIHNNNKYILSNNMINHSPVVEVFLDPTNLHVDKISDNILELSGYSSSDFYKENICFMDLIIKNDKEQIKEEIHSAITEKKKQIELEYKIKTKNGEEEHVFNKLFLQYTSNGDVETIYGYMQNVSELYITDFGLPNYKSLLDSIDNNNYKDVILLKIRNFDYLNGLFGREYGTELLNLVSKRLKEILLKYNFGKLFQVSPTEYALLKIHDDSSYFFNIPLEELENFYNEISNIGIELNNLIKTNFNFTMAANFFAKQPLDKAYLALDKAKRDDSKITIYDSKMGEAEEAEHLDFLFWVEKLKNSIEGIDDNIDIFFQGIYNNNNNHIQKYETLIRYYDKDNDKIISPFFFLKHAEKAGIINKLFCIVIKKLIAYINNETDVEKINEYSINCKIEDILSNGNIETLITLLEENNISKDKIILEILEDASNHKGLLEKIIELKQLGFKIAIDDFGAGSSNFQRLLQIKPDYIKIDGEFVKNIKKGNDNYIVVKSIVDLAHNLKSQVIAEYVENQEIQDILLSLGVEFSQGYLYSKPFPPIHK